MCKDRTRTLTLGRSLLAHNEALASGLRRRFAVAGLPVVNLLASPGAGKTALLEALARHRGGDDLAVIVGDLATDLDARRLRQAGLTAVAVTTGQACHLDAAMVQRGLRRLDLERLALLLIENVGNLVCPAAFDLGESRRLVLLSVTEGEDKPLKHPALFHTADLVVISKVDLAAAVGFDGALARRHLRQVAPQARVLAVSARTGEGLPALVDALGLAAAGRR
ncbi:MAG: hydrogenase nickel incorporation protein HypB [Synechococcus sp. Tobar2m-G35]|nr:hydrogenase nickel incorporation protein HypB [Synechococcus sp. Tobar2m-G35]